MLPCKSNCNAEISFISNISETIMASSTIEAGNFCFELSDPSIDDTNGSEMPSVAAFLTKAASPEFLGVFFKSPMNVGLCFFKTDSKSFNIPG